MESKDIFSSVVVFLRALAMIHQNNHWQDGGQAFFAHHLLFERLYDETFESLDKAAERAVGTFGANVLNLSQQAKLLSTLLTRYSNESSSTLESSLKAESDFLSLAKKAYDTMKGNGDLSLGMDDLLMSICNTAESHVYLLKQSLI